MNNYSVPGLSGAVNLYTSDKLRERSQGLEQIKDIFDSRDNVTRFAESAAREGGAGWMVFFQCLFQVVVTEKKAVLKKAASAQADKRLSEAIGLVRRVAERTYHHLNKKPLMALVTHMISLLAYGGKIFPPAAIDYIKALKTLLSYPPHLEVLDQMSWRTIVGVCWASLLGDPVRLTDELENEIDEDEDEEGSDLDVKPSLLTQGANAQNRQKTLSTVNGEIAGLLPILLSSNAAPLLSPLPERDGVYIAEPSTGYNMLLKVVRFFQRYPNDNNAHLSILQTLNAALTELELNARDEMISASVKLLPILANMWTTRKKDVREQVLLALRITLPFATHKLAAEHDKSGVVRESLSRIFDHLTKEGQLRWGCEPLDLSVIRLKRVSRKGKEKEDLSPFATSCMRAGFEFSHEYAMSWAIEQVYADICFHLYDTLHSVQAMTPTTQPGTKRRRVESALSTLVANLDAGSIASRLLHIQVLILLCEQHHNDLHIEAQLDIRRNLLDLLDSDNMQIQSWALVALAHLASAERHAPQRSSLPDEYGTEGYPDRTGQASADWDRVWAHATRKIAIPAVSRAASHAADCLLACELAQTARHLDDLRSIMVNIEVQGPPVPFDSVCAFLCRAITIARNDATMYQLSLDDKVMNWMCKWSPTEASKAKSRMDQLSAADLYRLLCEATRVDPLAFSDVDVSEALPDCAIAERCRQEAINEPLWRFMLYARFPARADRRTGKTSDEGSSPATTGHDTSSGSLENLQGRTTVGIMFLIKSLEAAIGDCTNGNISSSMPAERVRKAVDLVVASFAYLGTLHSRGYQSDPTCLHSAIRLLEVIKPALSSQAYSMPSQRLMWAGFTPLSSTRIDQSTVWPIILEASVEKSGIRRVLFPQESQNETAEVAPAPQDDLQRLVWRDSTMCAALREISESALQAIGSLSQLSPTNGSAGYAVATAADDFGEINIAETDAMPQSREAMECRTTTSSLIDVLARFRVSASLLASPHGYPGRDANLINIWLNTDGTKFVQTGRVVCDILQEGLLRLNVDAVDLVFGALEEMIGSYAYTRDPALLELTLSFLGVSAVVWLSQDAESSDLPDRAIKLGKFLLVKASRGQIASWRVRLAIILFIDEYLDYDNSAALWLQSSEHDDRMQIDDIDDSPFTFITSMLNDIDSRVRIRAATSAAALFYLSGFSAASQSTLYHHALERQSGQKDHWDSFKDHFLWKLNCCVTSVPLRATTIFHLYEYLPIATAIHHHFQTGMQSVAERLHLGSVAGLFRPYAVIICLSQASSGQKTLMQPYKLYGFPTKAAFGSSLLQLVGPNALINDHAYTLFKDACDASSISLEWAASRHLPAAAAYELADQCIRTSDQKTIDSSLAKTFSKLPGIRNNKQLQQLITAQIDLVIASLIPVLDLAGTVDDLASLLKHRSVSPDAADVFTRIISIDDAADDPAVNALTPSLPASTVLATLAYCSSRYPTMSPPKIVFHSFELLFERMNGTCFAAEERRHWRNLAFVIALFPQTLEEPVILQTLLREIVSRLEMTDFPEIALSMLQWGFDRIPLLAKRLDELPEIMIHLGEVRHRLGQGGELSRTTAEVMDNWLVEQIPIWTDRETVRDSLDFAMAFWPRELTVMFTEWTDPSFADLAMIAQTPRSKIFSSMTLCSGLARELGKGGGVEEKQLFVKRIFWHLKTTLSERACTDHGVRGLLELLAQVNGDIHAPDLATADGMSVDRVAVHLQEALVGEPETMLRGILITKVAELTRHKDYVLRSTALRVLRRSHAAINQLLEKGLFRAGTTPQGRLLELLLPKDDHHIPAETTLDVLQHDDAWVKRATSGPSWISQISRLVCEILAKEDDMYLAFIPLFEVSMEAASDTLPWLVQALLTIGSAQQLEVAEARSSILSIYLARLLRTSSSSVEVLRSIIKIVLHLRSFSPSYRIGVMAFNHWLDIEPILLSEAANCCGAYATALLFLETLKDDDNGPGLDLLNPRVQKIMYEIYSNVEDPDGFYGVQNHDVRGALQKRLQHERLSLRAFGLHGAAFEANSNSRGRDQAIFPLLANLHDMGFNRLSSAVHQSSRSVQDTSEDHDRLLLDLAWRTGDWDLPVSSAVGKTSHGSFYTCLRSVHRQRDQQAVAKLVMRSIHTEIGRIGHLGLEQMAQIKQSASTLVCLREMALWLDDATQRAISTGERNHPSLQTFGAMDDNMDFAMAERLAATRLSLLQAAHARESQFLIGDLTTPSTEAIVGLQKMLYLQLGRLARQDGKLQAAVNAITAVQSLEQNTGDSDEANDEFGHVLWAQKEHALAIQHVSQMATALEKSGNSNGRLAVLLAQMAHWTSVAKMRAPQEIKATFDKAYHMTKSSKLGPAEQARVCHEYALFADGHYQSLVKSPELERLRANRDRTQSALDIIESASKTSKSRSASARTDESRRQDVMEDDRALKDLERELTTFTKMAMKMFAMALIASNEFDDSTTRLCSLWLEHDSSEDVNGSFRGALQAIPSHKFIFLGPQLAARLYKPKQPSAFNKNLNDLMLRLSRDHPFHILYQVITVAQGADAPSGSSSRSKRASDVSMLEGRAPAAQEILARLKDNNERELARDAANNMSRLTDAAVPWCHHQDPENRSSRADTQMVKGNPLLAFVNVSIPPPSVVPPVDISRKYENIATVARYRSHYRVLGGIHRPKRMTCIDSLNHEHYELFKGDDELRQDAVMEQVFEMTNRILGRDRKTKARDLRFRTYAVIPLPNRSGIMEFVGDSQAIGEYLKPAHIKYRNGLDHPPDYMRKKLEEVQVKDQNSSELTRRYTELMTKFKPVMRHYFTEKHREPMAWFSMRLNYIRSVAVTSIVGHVLGIGDRHCSNILIDKMTGELVHIDFGIVFEDGRRLRIPEKVPFRLTNDIVDGLGLTGVDGTFRQCSEHTLRVLRESADLILTVLEVFKHDPLYAWAADTEKLKRAQGGGRVDGQSATATEKADRVLSKIRQKLRPDLSVEYTVNQLIQEARDPDNLAKIFIGWQPWL